MTKKNNLSQELDIKINNDLVQSMEFFLEDVKFACLLIVNKDGFVMGSPRKNNPNDYGLLGGHVEFGEQPLDAAIREAFEEASIVVDPATCVLLYVRPDNTYSNLGMSATYLVQSDQEFVPGQGDYGMAKWVTWEQLESGTFGAYNKKLHIIYNNFISENKKESSS